MAPRHVSMYVVDEPLWDGAMPSRYARAEEFFSTLFSL
jgi:hypothetical protein